MYYITKINYNFIIMKKLKYYKFLSKSNSNITIKLQYIMIIKIFQTLWNI
jgi:hypothetical protein